MTAAEQRACPRCGRAFTWTTSAPRQKYCSTVMAGGTAPGSGTTAVRPCPHCGQPVTAVTWIIPPAAATVTAP